MRYITSVLSLCVLCLPVLAVGTLAGQASRPSRPVHTYSIVAVDSLTGDIGVAVQSHWFSVGGVVPWAAPGVGAVATQSFIEPAYGYGRAARMLPDAATNGELVYWQGVTLADLGNVTDAIPLLRRAFVQDRAWIELLWRLPRVGLLGADSVTIRRIVQEAAPSR